MKKLLAKARSWRQYYTQTPTATVGMTPGFNMMDTMDMHASNKSLLSENFSQLQCNYHGFSSVTGIPGMQPENWDFTQDMQTLMLPLQDVTSLPDGQQMSAQLVADGGWNRS
jgi:hypothetical protein